MLPSEGKALLMRAQRTEAWLGECAYIWGRGPEGKHAWCSWGARRRPLFVAGAGTIRSGCWREARAGALGMDFVLCSEGERGLSEGFEQETTLPRLLEKEHAGRCMGFTVSPLQPRPREMALELGCVPVGEQTQGVRFDKSNRKAFSGPQLV